METAEASVNAGVARGWRAACVVCMVAAALSPARAQWSVTVLDGHDSSNTEAHAVSGASIAGYTVLGSKRHAAYWASPAAAWIDLMPQGWQQSEATCIDSYQQGGRVVRSNGSVVHAAVWSGNAESFVDLHPQGLDYSIVLGLSHGQQVGYVYTGSTYLASLWLGTAESWVNLNPPGARSSFSGGTNGVHQVGTSNFDIGARASLWTGTPESWVDLTPSAASGAGAFAIWGDSQVGVATIGNWGHASLWHGSSDSWVDLNPEGAESSDAEGVYGDFQVGSYKAGVFHAALWSGSPDSCVDLQSMLPSHYYQSGATGISSDGSTLYVVGWAANTITNSNDAVVWSRPIPGPGVGAVLGFGVIVMMNRRGRSRVATAFARTSGGTAPGSTDPNANFTY